MKRKMLTVVLGSLFFFGWANAQEAKVEQKGGVEELAKNTVQTDQEVGAPKKTDPGPSPLILNIKVKQQKQK